MRIRPCLAFASVLLSSWLASAAEQAATSAPRAWAHESGDLKPDAAVIFGRLDNGVRYAIRPNVEPKERVSLRLLVGAGSLNETEKQRGLAHFLEHMAFNGSTHFPPGSIVEYFQRLGMGFGADANANTGFEHTTYLVELPKNDRASLEEGLRALRDYADGMLLGADEIEKERGIILSEKRDRDSVEFRALEAEYNFVFPGTIIPQRFPIGTDEVVRTAKRDEFVDFYNTWYRPERMAIVAVGPIEPAELAALIRTAFADLKNRAPARTEPDRGRLVIRDGFTAKLHHDPELSRVSISIHALSPYAFETDTSAVRVNRLPRLVANAILNRRLSELAKKEGAPFTSASHGVSESFDLVRDASIDITAAKPEQWREALAVAEQELRRALEFGFQSSEVREVVANYLNGLEEDVRQAPTRHSSGLAEEITSTIANIAVFTSPDVDLALFKPALEKLSADDCLRALRAAWSPSNRLVFLAGNLPLAKPEQEIAAAFQASTAVKLEAPAQLNDQSWSYTDFGPAGKIAKRRRVEDLDFTQVEFENGVRLNLKRTDFEAAEITVSVRLGGGTLTLPADKQGLNLFFNAASRLMGLGKLSLDDLRRTLAGKSVGFGFSASNDAFTLRGDTTPRELELQLQLLAAGITDPGFRPEAERLIRRSLAQHYLRLSHVPDGPVQLELLPKLANGDPRFGLPPEATIASYTMDDLRAWISPELRDGAIELGIVGDLDVERTIELVAKTFGALPKRAAKPAYKEARTVAAPAKGFEERRQVKTEFPRGLLLQYWPSADAWDAPRARRLGVLASIIEDRLRVKVREGLGGAYSPGAANDSSDAYPGFGYLNVRVDVEPAKVDEIAAAVRELIEDLRTKGVTEDELDRAKKPILTSLTESFRTNGYWLGAVLSSAQEQPIRLEWSRTRKTDTESISKADIDALAAKYLLREREITFIVLPEAGAAAPTAAQPAPPTETAK